MSNMNLFRHGGDKNVNDGLNNNLIMILQEDRLTDYMNKAKILVRPKDIKVYSSETPK